jgi:hypothetical protein
MPCVRPGAPHACGAGEHELARLCDPLSGPAGGPAHPGDVLQASLEREAQTGYHLPGCGRRDAAAAQGLRGGETPDAVVQLRGLYELP